MHALNRFALVALALASAVGCASEDDTLTASDPALVAALETAAGEWQAAGVAATPAVSADGEANVLAVDDATFNTKCDTVKTTTLACTLAPVDGGKVHMWVRTSLLDNPRELQVIVTHEMGHVLQAHLAGSAPTHLPESDGCVDGAPESPHAMCAWAGAQITAADVALVEGL